jgi:hypothetical protein
VVAVVGVGREALRWAVAAFLAVRRVERKGMLVIQGIFSRKRSRVPVLWILLNNVMARSWWWGEYRGPDGRISRSYMQSVSTGEMWPLMQIGEAEAVVSRDISYVL